MICFEKTRVSLFYTNHIEPGGEKREDKPDARFGFGFLLLFLNKENQSWRHETIRREPNTTCCTLPSSPLILHGQDVLFISAIR